MSGFGKVCWRCGRLGTRQFIESGKSDAVGRWECANDRACRERADSRSDHDGVMATTSETITETCPVCGETETVPNKGLGRAKIAAWRTRHQHPEARTEETA